MKEMGHVRFSSISAGAKASLALEGGGGRVDRFQLKLDAPESSSPMFDTDAVLQTETSAAVLNLNHSFVRLFAMMFAITW
jgi:hypothetical protein